MDTVFRYLVLAKKLIVEQSQGERVTLVCASATALPFERDAFDLITAVDVMEHVKDPAKCLFEVDRVMKPDGMLFANSPNRFDLFTPEAHVGLWWIGFLPRRFVGKYVRWRGLGDYVGTRPLSYREFKRLLGLLTAAGSRRLVLDGLMVATKSNSAKKRFLRRHPWILSTVNFLFRPFVPSYNALICKRVLVFGISLT